MTHKSTAALVAAGSVAVFLTACPSVRAANLIWAPPSPDAWTWDVGAAASWADEKGQKTFSNGDSVLFDSHETGAPANRTVSVRGGGVNPSELSFSGGNDYVFKGGPIAVGSALTLGGTGAVIFNNAVTAAKTDFLSGTLGFAGPFDAGFFSAGDGTVKAVGTGVSTFLFSVPEGSNSTVSCAWQKGEGGGVELHKRGPGEATVDVKKLAEAIGGNHVYVDEGVLIGTGYRNWGDGNPGDMIYEVGTNAALRSTGDYALGGNGGGIRVYLAPGATFSPVGYQFLSTNNPALWLKGNASVKGSTFNMKTLHIKAEGAGNHIYWPGNYFEDYGADLFFEVLEGGELLVDWLDCNMAITKTGPGTLMVADTEYLRAGATLTVSGGTLAVVSNFTSLATMPVSVADGAAFTNATPGVFWLADTACSSEGSGAFFGDFGSKSAVQNFTNGLTVKGRFHISGDGFRADYTGLTVDGRAALECGIHPPLVFPNGLAFANGSAVEVAGSAAAPANIAGTVFPARLELPAGSHVYVGAPAGAPAAVLQAGVTVAADTTVHLALTDSLIPAGTYPVFTGIAELPEHLPKIAGHLAAVESAEWVFDDGALAVKVEMTGEVKTLTWRPAAGGEAAWSGTDANWEDPEGGRVPFSPGDAAVFDGREQNFAAAVDVAEGQTPGAVSFSGDRDYTLAGAKLGGAGAFTKSGAGTLTIDGGGLDAQPVIVSNGVLRLGANAAANALGHPAAPVTVEAGGAVDVNYTATNAYDFARNELTRRKIFKIAGDGFEGRGALVNDGPNISYRTFSRIELDGDASIGGTKALGMGIESMDPPEESEALQKRPLITGPGHTLTVRNTNGFYLADTDIDVGRIVLSGGGHLSLERGSSVAAPGGIELAGGMLDTWEMSGRIDVPIVSRGGVTNQLGISKYYAHYGSNVTVEAGGTLDVIGTYLGYSSFYAPVTTEEQSTLQVSGNATFYEPVTGPGLVKTVSGWAEYNKGIIAPKLLNEGGETYFGDQGSEEEYPVPAEIEMPGGDVYMRFVGQRLFTNLTVTGTGGTFWPAYVYDKASSGDVATYKNCSINTYAIYLAKGSRGGDVVFADGVDAEVKYLYIDGRDNAMSSSLTLKEGSEVTVTGETSIGNYNSSDDSLWELVVDGGTLTQNSDDTPLYIAYRAKDARLRMESGTLNASGLNIRGNWSANSEFSAAREVFEMNGGTLNLGAGGFYTLRGFAYEPHVCLNGGVLNSMADWGVKTYENISFGGFRGKPDGAFTLNLSGRSVGFDTALQGGASVTLAGNGRFLNRAVGPQGIVSGHWRVENTGKNLLLGAAGFKKGLTLAENVAAAVKIHAPDSYVSMAAYAQCGRDAAASFHDRDLHYPWFSGRMHDDLVKRDSLADNVFAYQGEFWVEPGDAGDWTFACTYNDELRLSIDGLPVCSNASWSLVSQPAVVDLAAGWHGFKVTARNLNGGEDSAGLAAEGWEEAGLAIGYHVGALMSTAASLYTRFDTDTLRMRPPTSCSVLHRRIGSVKDEAGWDTRTDFNKEEVLTSLDGIHSSTWPDGDRAINEFTGHFWAEEEGRYEFWAKYDDMILLEIDGVEVLKSPSHCAVMDNIYQELSHGWHSFRVRTYDIGSGAWGNSYDAAALYVIRPSDSGADWPQTTQFRESSYRVVAELPAFGKIGGELELAAGSVLTNEARTAASVTGTLSGTGTLEGPFRLDGGVYALTGGGRRRALDGVSFGAGAHPDALRDVGTIRVAFDGSPMCARYRAGPAMGLEKLSPAELAALRVEVTAETGEGTETLTGEFAPEVEDGILFLRNLHSGGMLLILR